MTLNRSPDPMHQRRAATPATQNYSCAEVAPESAPTTCGAKTRGGSPCRNLPMKNGRCRMHGGGSTGPKTAAGLARWRAAVTIHGGRSREMKEFRARVRNLRACARQLVEIT